MNSVDTPTIDQIYSKEHRNKLLTVKMSPSELETLANTARNSGNTISSFTRKALQNYIQTLAIN